MTIFSFEFFRFRKKTLDRVAVFVLAAFVVGVLAFWKPLRDIDEYSDLGNYSAFWSDLQSISFSDAVLRFEPGFVLLCKVCSTIFSFSGFTWFVQFTVFYSLFVFCARYTRGATAAVAVAIAALLFYLPITSMATLVIRQGIATAVFFCFLARYHGGNVKLLKAFPWMVCMVSLHYSSVFVLLTLLTLPIARGMRSFYLWCIFMMLYCAGISGQIGLLFYQSLGLNVASLNALNNSSGVEYEVGFKVSFLLLNLFYVVLPVALILAGVVRISVRQLLSDNLFRLYFMLNALATIFSLMPFYDRFFMWSWAIGPVMLVAVLAKHRRASSNVAMRDMPNGGGRLASAANE